MSDRDEPLEGLPPIELVEGREGSDQSAPARGGNALESGQADPSPPARGGRAAEGDEGGAPPPDPAELGLELPEQPGEAVVFLLRELVTARTEGDAYLDDLRRVAADFDNFRKRVQRDQAALVERASERVTSAMLPVLDSFDAALAIEAETESEQKLLSGMRGTRAQLFDILAKEGLEVIPTWGEPFDPEVHEAVTAPREGEGRLVVTEEYRRGYRLRGKVLRAAVVAVAYE